MATAAASPPEQGQLVSVRQRHYVVTEVARSALPEHPLRPTGNGAQHLVTLASVEDDALSEEIQVIWEIEPSAEVIERVALPEPTGFDDPERLDAFLDAVRWGAARFADVKSVQSPFRSGIEIEDYQLEGRQKLSRITARIVPDRVLEAPAMIAHARLVVIGGDRHRLHEDIITAGGLLREGRFARFRTLREMDEALAAATDEEPSGALKKKLLALWPQTADSLRQALDARMRDLTDGLKKTLADRAEKEAGDIKTILNELKKAIQVELDDPEYRQRFLPGMSPVEVEQLDRNVEALRRRVAEIPKEIEKETAAIKARFADPQPRMFPVAVTFLVPEKCAK